MIVSQRKLMDFIMYIEHVRKDNACVDPSNLDFTANFVKKL